MSQIKYSNLIIFFLSISLPAIAYSGTYTNFAGIKFIDIPTSSFQMGSCNLLFPEIAQSLCSDRTLHDPDSFSDELPMHNVSLSRNIQIGIFEITVNEFTQALDHNDLVYLKKNETFLDINSNDNNPVRFISWEDAQAYIGWLNKRKPYADQGTYRLPTEAEWEYAARAGTNEIYFFGNSAQGLKKYCWYADNSNEKETPVVHKVGTKSSNSFGVYDIYGNVWEWVSDRYASNYYQTSAVENPDGPFRGKMRVIRGGAFNFDASHCRSAARESYLPDSRSAAIGFRIVRELH